MLYLKFKNNRTALIILDNVNVLNIVFKFQFDTERIQVCQTLYINPNNFNSIKSSVYS